MTLVVRHTETNVLKIYVKFDTNKANCTDIQ